MTREIISTPDGGKLELFSTGAELATAGSGVVVVTASMVTAADYTRFAQKLSASLGRPVHTFNRRGRGASSEQAGDYTLDLWGQTADGRRSAPRRLRLTVARPWW